MIYLQNRAAGLVFLGVSMLLASPAFSQAFRAMSSQNEGQLLRPFGILVLPVPEPRHIDSMHFNNFEPAFQFGDFKFAAAGVRANYNFGSNYSQFGFGGGILSGPLAGTSQFQFNAGYGHYSSSYSYSSPTFSETTTQAGNTLNLSAIYFWNECDWRFGPTAGYGWNWWNYSYSNSLYNDQSNPIYNSHAFNVGGYGQWLPSCGFTGSAKAGGIFGDDSGWYGGLSLGYYFCDDFDFCGDYDYYSFDAWKVYGLRADWQVSQTTPLAVSAGFNYNAYGNGSTDTRYSIGLKYQWNIPTSHTLEDREHTGLITNYQVKF